jgi:hypothetical protein
VVLILAAAVQVRLLAKAWQSHTLAVLCAGLVTVTFWRWLFVLGVAAYVAALSIGPVPRIGWAWLTAIAACYTLLLWLTAQSRVLESWRNWSRGRLGRRVTILASCSIVLLIAVEGGLRINRLAGHHGWYRQVGPRAERAPAAGSRHETEIPTPTSANAQRLPSGPFRVAVAAAHDELETAYGNGYLARVKQMFPGLEIVPMSLDRPWDRHSAGDLAARSSQAKVDLLLVMVPVCQDVPRAACAKSWFDWRAFELAETLLGRQPSEETPRRGVRPAAGDDFEAFLDRLGPQLASCRAPQGEAMRLQWQQTFASLDRTLTDCRDLKLPVALVLVPGQFQVDPMLADTLARRHGYASGQLDLELPQRKWAGFAEPRKVPLVDLLGPLRLCRQSAYERNTQTWNEAGNATAAAAIGGWLESRYGRQLSLAAQLTSSP